METILVFNVAASAGGALTILREYYEKAINDTENQWIFILSTPKFEQRKNIRVINYPWIKKSWLHRLFFDSFFPQKIIKKYKPTKIISLQNIAIKTKIDQELYLHQSIPFTEYKFKLVSNTKLWIYQNIIGRKIKKNFKYAAKILVQTQWMKEEAGKYTDKSIEIISPSVKIPSGSLYKKEEKLNYFYPAAALLYKNHDLIIKTLIRLTDISDKFTVYFTLKGSENRKIKKLKHLVLKNNLPIVFLGTLSYDEVINWYSKSTLIFPSYLETFGLPLLEASVIGSPIRASNMPFSREILRDYFDKVFFDPESIEELEGIIRKDVKKHYEKKDYS